MRYGGIIILRLIVVRGGLMGGGMRSYLSLLSALA